MDNPADWVRLEIETALNRGDVRVIPVLLDKVSMPAAQDLPVSLQSLCSRHAANVRQDPDFSRDMDYVLSVVEQHLNPGKTSLSKQPVIRKRFGNWPRKQNLDRLSDRILDKQKKDDKQSVMPDYDKGIIQVKLDHQHVTEHLSGLDKANLGDNQGAIIDYDKAIQLKPDYVDAYMSRGMAKYELGDYQGAITDYDKAIQLKPDFANAYAMRGMAKSDLGDKQGGITDGEKFRALRRSKETLNPS